MYWDLPALRGALPVLTFAEFQAKHGAAKQLDLATAASFANVPDRVYGNVDIIWGHLSRISQLDTTRHTVWAMLYFVPC